MVIQPANAAAAYRALNLNNLLDAQIIQAFHPLAVRAGRNRVYDGIVRDEVVTATTGHTYDYYHAMIWDNRTNSNAAIPAIDQWRAGLGLPIINSVTYSYAGLERKASRAILSAN